MTLKHEMVRKDFPNLKFYINCKYYGSFVNYWFVSHWKRVPFQTIEVLFVFPLFKWNILVDETYRRDEKMQRSTCHATSRTKSHWIRTSVRRTRWLNSWGWKSSSGTIYEFWNSMYIQIRAQGVVQTKQSINHSLLNLDTCSRNFLIQFGLNSFALRTKAMARKSKQTINDWVFLLTSSSNFLIKFSSA